LVTAKNQNSQNQDQPFLKSFSGHETFPFRFSWLKKGVDLLLREPGVFQNEDAVVKFGVGKNMVQSIRHWCLATRVAEERTNYKGLYPTPLGIKLFSDNGLDPYLEDDATLWLLHWNLASKGTKAATWYWTFNRFSEFAFTRSSLFEALFKEIHNSNWGKVSESTLKRDVDCFVLTYYQKQAEKYTNENTLGCPLTDLELLIQESDSERMRFNIGLKPSLPPELFAFTLAQFWNQRNHNAKTLDLREILSSEGSPSLVFKLDQDSVLLYLDQLERVTTGKLVFQDTSLVRQVAMQTSSLEDSLYILENYYGGK